MMEEIEEFQGRCIRMNLPVNTYMLNKLFMSYKNWERILRIKKEFMGN
jgi:hypothetical protein